MDPYPGMGNEIHLWNTKENENKENKEWKRLT